MHLILLLIGLFFNYPSNGDPCTPSDNFVHSISTSAPSSVLNITFSNPDSSLNLISCEELTVDSKWTGGKLILSDSPESPQGPGKLYEHHNLPPTTSNRIFMYHVNGKSAGNMRFSVLIQNTSPTEAATVQVIKSGVAGPSPNYLYAGKTAAERWLRSSGSNEPLEEIPPGGIVQLDPSFHTHSVSPGLLLHGIWDYSITTSHSVILCSMEVNEDPINDCISSQLHSKDVHIRGTFPNAEKTLSYSVDSNLNQVVLQFPIGDGLVDEFASGEDATDGSVQQNSGNFGVAYRIPVKVPHASSITSYLANPRGGVWAGVVEFSGQTFLLPENTSSVRNNTHGVFIGSFDISSEGTEMTFLPVGGSNLPIRIALVKSSIH